jgi:hypothetical protein
MFLIKLGLRIFLRDLIIKATLIKLLANNCIRYLDTEKFHFSCVVHGRIVKSN